MKSGCAVRRWGEAGAGVVVVVVSLLLLEAAGKSGLCLCCAGSELERARLLFRDTLPRKQRVGRHWLLGHVKDMYILYTILLKPRLP